jgi:hypothetical protein
LQVPHERLRDKPKLPLQQSTHEVHDKVPWGQRIEYQLLQHGNV